jgi:NADPH:quinone reductase-like Zn-dependent oxidoreductase
VVATTRRAERIDELIDNGADHAIVDDGDAAAKVRQIFPDGVDAALELVGTSVLADTMGAVRFHGVVCVSGSLSDSWTIDGFYPIGDIPNGVRLTGYFGDAGDLPTDAFQSILDDIAAGELSFPVHRVYDGLDEVRQAHTDMETNAATGKLVVRVRH